MIGSFFLRSHTTVRPFGEVEANICWTCLFQATPLMSSSGWSLDPGLMGDARLLRSQIKTSDSPAPVAIRLGWKGLISSALTAPTCWSRFTTNAPSLLDLKLKI